MSGTISRRNFLKGMAGAAGALLLGGLGWKTVSSKKRWPGRLLGPTVNRGHQVRDHHDFGKPQVFQETDVVIVGGGMAGLSAAWWLEKHGLNNFLLLEMEKNVGGNAQSGRNAISSYPWGAHYVPMPGEDAKYVRLLFEELGVIRGYDAKERPMYEELYLCHDPEERLLMDGRWQEGLVPQRGLRADEKREMERFLSRMHTFKTAIGRDGKKAFTIPLDLSSADPAYRQLDRISMTQWLKEQGFRSKPVRWYVDYCCRDDYGATAEEVSAWAGIHYFAARDAHVANADTDGATVLTWPEGNGWLANRLRSKVQDHIRTQAMACRIFEDGNHVMVDYLDQAKNRMVQIKAQNVIYAGPRFVAQHIVQALRDNPAAYLQDLQYAPWMVANVSLNRLPEGEGAPLSWDNVSYYSQFLGYVVATHQNIELFPNRTVLTCYWPLTHKPPKEARKEAYQRTHAEWADAVVSDLSRIHPGIEEDIEAVDVWLWGHGMIRPSAGFIWGESRQQMREPLGRIYFAHSDMSGISIFEEAQYQGVEAAKKVLEALGARTA